MSAKNSLNYSEFNKILKNEKDRVEKNIEVIKAEVEALVLEDDIDDPVDMAEMQIDNMTDQTLLNGLQTELAEINAALARIKDGTYGICEKTGKAIPVERLKANPWTRTVAKS